MPADQPRRPRRRTHLAAVAVGGAAGTLLRAALAETVPTAGGWPLPTLAANVAGTTLLAWLVIRRPALMEPSGTGRSLLGIGFCGGLTTFSLFQVELVDLLDAGRPLLALGYAGVSVLAGLVAVFAIRPVRAAT